MVTYQGVVHGDTVLLPQDVHLPEGLVVEVRAALSTATDDVADREAALYERLVASGRLLPPTPGPHVPIEPIQPDEISGMPLSQIIIEDRR